MSTSFVSPSLNNYDMGNYMFVPEPKEFDIKHKWKWLGFSKKDKYLTLLI